MARHHIPRRAHTALKAASAFSDCFPDPPDSNKPTLILTIRVENALLRWYRSKLSPFGILTQRQCPHQLFHVSQRRPPPANKSEISLTSKTSRKDERPHVGLPHPIPLKPPLPSATQTGSQQLDWIQILYMKKFRYDSSASPDPG